MEGIPKNVVEVIQKNVVVVGNSGCGKTNLLTMLSQNTFTENNPPTAFIYKYPTRIGHEGRLVQLSLVDTSGEIFGRLARLCGHVQRAIELYRNFIYIFV